jgi:RND family efflux transporter MFP subunit
MNEKKSMKTIRIFVAILTCCYSLSGWGERPLICLIQPDSEADIGSPVVGVVESINVERGDKVKKGQVLAKLRSRVEAASLRVAKTRAEADADVKAARANYLYLKQEYVRAEDLYKQKFISKAALEKSRAEMDVAREKLEQAKKQRDVWKREVELAKAQLELRAIRAPFSGMVAERHVSVGERIEDQPMFRVTRVDPLRVEIVVPAALFGTIQKGMDIRVTPDLPNFAPLDAKVILVDEFVDAASNTFRVRASLPNSEGKIPYGSRCTALLIESSTDNAKSFPQSAPAEGSETQKLKVNLKQDDTTSTPKNSAAARRKVKQ